MAREDLAGKSSRYLRYRLERRIVRLAKARVRVKALEKEVDQVRTAMDLALAREAGIDKGNAK